MSHIFKSRTIWFAIALAILSVIEGYLHIFNLSPPHQALAGVLIAVVITVLRFVTTVPLDKR